MLALGLLVASKLLTVQVPFFFKHAVDALNIDPTGATTSTYLGMFHLSPIACLMGYGISRAGAAFCGEMRNVVFAKVMQTGMHGCLLVCACDCTGSSQSCMVLRGLVIT